MDQDELAEAIAKSGNEGLTTFDLSRKGLTTLPREIGNPIGLTYLDLRNNQLTALPPGIGNLTNLTKLYLSNNQLAAWPQTSSIKKRNQVPNASVKYDSNRVSGLTQCNEFSGASGGRQIPFRSS